MELYEKYDGCYGVVTRSHTKGVSLMLDNGETAYALKFESLRPGTPVLCTVLKPAHEDRDTFVSIDSVVFHHNAA